MTTSMKARYRRALRYGQRLHRMSPGIVFPPSVTIAYAHSVDPKLFPLKSRRVWTRKAKP